MSKLPPALAARLAKRGLLQSAANAPPTTNVPNRFEEEEEVIAEDYDDLNKSNSSTFDPIITVTSFSKIDRKVYPTVSGCPNKYNVYHNCSAYCVKRYRDLDDQQPPRVVKKKFWRLLQKFPLKQEQTEIWEQIYDPGLKTYYFWNTETDQVSWLPPSHPDCKPSIPAEKLRKLLREDDDFDDEEDNDDFDNNRRNRGSEDSGNSDESGSDEDEDDDDDMDSDLEGSMNSDASDSVNSEEEDNPTRPCSKFPIRKSQVAPPMALSKTISNKIESNPSRKQIPQKRNDLDPMDPASYSDIPRGKWSDGLKESREKGD